MKSYSLLFGALAVIGAAAQASTSDVTLWKGETRAVILHDADDFGLPPDGIELRFGVAKSIRYLDRAYGTHYREMADRVEWDSTDPGLRVMSVTAAADAKPGDYQIGELKVKVLDRVLPPVKDWKYCLDLWQHPWAVSRYFGTKPFSPKHYAAMKPLWELLASAGQKALTVTITKRPWNHQCFDAYDTMVRHIKLDDGTWRFDYSVLDEYIEFGRRCGIGPDIACYTMCPWQYGVFWEDERGAEHKVQAVPGTKEFEDYWGDFLVDFEKHMRAKGWLEDTYICMDERSPEDVMNICRFIKRKSPGFKVSLAGNRPPSEFEGIVIDNACFSLGNLSDRFIAEAEARRKQGMRTTYYVCCGPMQPNTMCHNEIEEAFWLGVYPALCGLDGFLRWAWNSWPRDPMHDATFFTHHGLGWSSGDTYLVYPDGSPSLRFLQLRNGIIAAEKLRILGEQGLFADEIKALAGRFDRQAAMENKADFVRLMIDVQNLLAK